MKNYPARVYPSKERLNRKDQLAWKIASVAVDVAPVDLQATDMVINRIIDNTFLAIAAANGEPPEAARAQALTHPREKGYAFWVAMLISLWMPNGPPGQISGQIT